MVGFALGAGRTIVLGAGAETALAGTAVPATDSFVASFEIGVLVRGSVELDPGVALGVAPEVESPAESAGDLAGLPLSLEPWRHRKGRRHRKPRRMALGWLRCKHVLHEQGENGAGIVGFSVLSAE